MEDSNFKTVRKGLIIICLIVISLFLLKIEISTTKLSLPFLGGANINSPEWLFPIIYCFLAYYTWKYYQYLFHAHEEGNVLKKIHTHLHNYRHDMYASKAEHRARIELGTNFIDNKILRRVNKSHYRYIYTIRGGDEHTIDIKISFIKVLFKYAATQPEFTRVILPIILLIGAVFVILLPEWDGGLSLWSFVK